MSDKLITVKGKTSIGDLSFGKQTGWSKSPDNLDFGREGIVGHNWKQLDVITDFGRLICIEGVKCDYNVNPFKVSFSDDGKDWSKHTMKNIECKESETVFDKPVRARYGRMIWAKTNGSQGFHAQFLVKASSYVADINYLNGRITLGSFAFGNQTGWAKNPQLLDFDKEGIVGHFWNQLDVITDFGKGVEIDGISCDYDKHDVLIMFSDDGKDWSKYEMKNVDFKDKIHYEFDKSIKTRFGRMLWWKTDHSKGFHAQFTSHNNYNNQNENENENDKMGNTEGQQVTKD